MARKTKYGWENMESGDEFFLDTDKEGARRAYLAGYNYCRANRPDHKIVRKKVEGGYRFILASINEAKAIKESVNTSKQYDPTDKRVHCIGVFHQNTCELLTWTTNWESAAKYAQTTDSEKFRSRIRSTSTYPIKDSDYGFRWAYFITNLRMPEETIVKTLQEMADRKFLASRMRSLIKDPRKLNKVSMDALRICANTLKYENNYGTPPEYYAGQKPVKSK